MQLNIDSAIFIGFLVLNLIIGLWHGKGVKTIGDYALGGRNFSTAALVATMLATFMDGGGFFIAFSETYSQGLTYIIATLAIAAQLLIIGYFLLPRMNEFMGALSVAEAMGNLYGSKVRGITAACGILADIGFIAAQFKVFGSLMHYLTGVSEIYGIIIAASIVVLYSAFGGIRAITYTDVLQFITFGFVIPLIGLVVWVNFKELNFSLSSALQNPIFDYKKLLELPKEKAYSFIFLTIYFLFPTLYPTGFQRISMGRNIKQVQTANLITALLFIVIFLAMAWTPFLIANINPNLDPNDITSYMINNYAPIGLKGLIIIGITALAMSSADSSINAASVLFAYDLKETLRIKMNNLVLSKIFALALGVLAIYMAIYSNNILNMIRATAAFYMPIVAIPLLFSILGFRSSTKSVLASMGAGFITVITLMLLDANEIIVPGMIANIIVLFGYHYIFRQQGGWIGIKDKNFLESIRQKRRVEIYRFINNLKNLNFIEFCKKTAPKDEMMYTWLGIYCILFTISTMYSTQTALHGANGKMILTVYQIMMCTGVITAMYPIWPPRIKHQIIMQVAWNFIIFFMLIFFSCFFVMLSNFGQLQLIIFTINIIMTAILVGWKLSFGMMLVGFYLSINFYKYYAGLNELNISIGSPEFIFIYSLMLVGSSLIIFLKPKQEHYVLVEGKNEHLSDRVQIQEEQVQAALAIKGEIIKNITHEYNTPVASITSLAQSLWQYYHKLSDKERIEISELIFKSAKRLGNLDDNLSNLSKLTAANYKLNLEQINLSDLVYKCTETCRNFYEENKEDRVFDINIQENITVEGDEYYLSKALENLIINAITYCPKGKIKIDLTSVPVQDKTQNQAVFSIEDTGIGIPKEELYDIFAEFTVSSKTKTPAGGRGIGLALTKRVVEVHKGKVYAESDGEVGAKFILILPLA